MGRKSQEKLEGLVRTRARRGMLERIVLGTLVIGGLAPVALMAPKLLRLIKEEHLDYVLPQDPRQRLYEVMSRLKREGFIRWRERGGKRYPELTDAGRRRARQIVLGELSIPKPRRWDERWRIVTFDIKQEDRLLRDKVRGIIKRLGFMRLQDSVWVYPYDCEEIITLLKTELRTGSTILYIIADAIEYDKPIRNFFGLPQR